MKQSTLDNGLAEYGQIRCLSGIAGLETLPSANRQNVIVARKEVYNPLGCLSQNFVQRRSFLGCGDGEEGNVLAKVYEEKRVMGYSPEQLYAVVAAVDMYQDFLPWCQRSDIVQTFPDGSFDAELVIGFKFLVESYISHVELRKPNYIKTSVSNSNLFDHLINIWEFHPGTVPGSCNLYFLVDFKFQSPFYRQMATMFFKEVVSRLVNSFNDRCRLIYGPGVPLTESTFEHTNNTR
jgi:coenzyme Q-binding protein COQ10